MLVDGKEFVGRRVFFLDLGLVLALGAVSIDDVYPFTCSCGAPGCVGLFEGTRLTADSTRVIWALPREPFTELVPEGFVTEEGPVVLEFERTQYEAELERITQAIEEISRVSGKPASIGPGSADMLDERDMHPLREKLAERRERIMDNEVFYAWREQTWGDLLGHDLVIALPNGFAYNIPFENLADVIAGADGITLDRDQMALIERDIAPEFRKGLDRIAELALTIDWPTLVEHLFWEESPSSSCTQEPYSKQAGWPDVVFTQRTRY